mmetsp:Transcript_6875/g.11449  ORF Transcript_6875/g.11449 Transcript_6875/m.11449 type:complete len:313 (+) Transcript_6875:90-1028(+)
MSAFAVTAQVPLRDGNVIPVIGFGTYLISKDQAKAACSAALTADYKHIDTAQGYKNEEEIGKSIKAWVKSGKERPFITTKLWPGMKPGEVNYDATIEACNSSLTKLGIDKIDLYLIHAPFAGSTGRIEQWKALMQLKESGKCKSIGVSNFNVKHLQEIEAAGLPLPAVNQLEVHPLCQQREIVEYCRGKGILVIAYSSLAPLSSWRPGQNSGKAPISTPVEGTTQGNAVPEAATALFRHLSDKYGVSEAQLLFRWALQRQFPILPKSVSPERIQQNLDLFGFAIDDEDMLRLDSLDQQRTYAWPMGDPCLTP